MWGEHVCRCMCVYMDGGDGMITHFTSKTLGKNDGGVPLMHTVNKATSAVSLFNFYIIEFTRVFFCVVFIIITALMDGVN